jgi:hypothetical protein
MHPTPAGRARQGEVRGQDQAIVRTWGAGVLRPYNGKRKTRSERSSLRGCG